MKKFFSLFVIAGIAVIGLVVYYLNHHSEMKAKEVKESLAQLKKGFAEKEAPLRQTGTPDEYVKAQNEVMQGYKVGLEKLAKLDESVLDLDGEKKKFAEADEKKAPSAEQRKLREEYLGLTKSTFEQLVSGSYRPILTFANEGARLDVMSLKRVQHADGEALRADFVAWGFPQEVAWGDINMRVWVSKEQKGKSEKIQEIKYKFDASSARPTIVINNGERWVKAFPPGVTFGYYYLQLLPRESESFDLVFHYKLTGEGGKVIDFEPTFEHLPVSEALMLPPGAKFQAQERESSEAERLGRSEDEGQPGKRAKK
jgi:hypothetical protein